MFLWLLAKVYGNSVLIKGGIKFVALANKLFNNKIVHSFQLLVYLNFSISMNLLPCCCFFFSLFLFQQHFLQGISSSLASCQHCNVFLLRTQDNSSKSEQHKHFKNEKSFVISNLKLLSFRATEALKRVANVNNKRGPKDGKELTSLRPSATDFSSIQKRKRTE